MTAGTPAPVGWTARQRAMLREMGLRGLPLPERVGSPRPHALVEPAAATPQAAGVASAPVSAALSGAAPAAAPAPPFPASAPAPAPPTVPLRLVEPQAGVATALDGLDWPALEAEVAGCRACRLCEGRSRTVFGTGSREAHWMVVGEAPGEEEDRRGEPFVGKSGQLLDAMLQAIGLSRAADAPPERAVYIANAVKCRPPGNRNPQPDELARCEPFLLRQIALLRPRRILAMGRFAVQSLLRSDEPIGRLRGRVHTVGGVPLVVTYHPAYLLRSPQEKARAWDDLSRARALAAPSFVAAAGALAAPPHGADGSGAAQGGPPEAERGG